jgi:transcriptional regulator with PAS, ATPase and Fis domain
MSATLLMPHEGNFAAKSPRLIGGSAPMRRLAARVDALGRRACTALLQGESGTGKELTARLIHLKSSRASGPFVPVDCTALRDTLVESQLFGHNRGAFTGADRSTMGFFRAADGGTLFLDEIGELPPPSQAKLLRAIQEGVVTPLGATTGISVNVRVIAATHRDLAAMVREGTFRQDLYYRLNVACLRLPPLRERREDIPLLIDFALADLARVYREPVRRFTVEAISLRCAHDWPGNVRELMNAVEHAIVFSQNTELLDVCDLPEDILIRAQADPVDALPNRLMTLAEAERRLIEMALRKFRGNQSQAARALQIERHRLSRRIAHFRLSDLAR